MAWELRIELFVADLDVFADFYTRVLGFTITDDRRHDEPPYLAVRRGQVRIGALHTWEPVDRSARAVPTGVEVVFEADDITAERDRVVAQGWPLDADLQTRPWGLTDFRLFDPDGYYLRITSRDPADPPGPLRRPRPGTGTWGNENLYLGLTTLSHATPPRGRRREMTARAHFTVFLTEIGYHESAWRLADPADLAAPARFGVLERAALTAERGLLDAVFFADSPGLEIFRARYFPQVGFDPLEILAALSQSTTHVGLIATASTTYSAPYDLARRFSTIDHLSGGRAGWNIVTTRYAGAAGNFGLAAHPAHEDRYARAEEFVEVVSRLWESWDAAAVVADQDKGVWANTDLIRPVDFHGRFFNVSGALTLPRSPQGRPAFAQAGSSGPGIELAGKTADLVFTAQPDIPSGRRFRDTVRAAAERHGRTGDDLLVLPGVAFVLGSTEAEARSFRASLEDRVDPEFRWRNLAHNAGLDAALIDPDRPLSAEAIAAAQRTSRTDDLVRRTRETGKTFRQLAEEFTGLPGGLEFTGTPEQFADLIESWVTEGASDGFTLQPTTLPGSLELFTDHVVPLLQARGLHRTEYTATTLRGHLADGRAGLPPGTAC